MGLVSAFLSVVAVATFVAQETATAPPRMPGADPAALDRTVDPCDDFYRFACGGWHAENPLPRGESFWSRPFSQFARQIDDYVASLVQTLAEAKSSSAHELRLAQAYLACVDTGEIDRRGLTPLRRELAHFQGPLTAEELPRILGELHSRLLWSPRHGEPFFYVDSGPATLSEPEVVGIDVGAAGLGLGSADAYRAEDEASRSLLEAYRRYVTDTFRRLGDSEEAAARKAEHVLDIETRLAAAYLPKSVWRNDPAASLREVTVEELIELTKGFDWREYFRAHGLPAVERVTLRDPLFFPQLGELLRGLGVEAWRPYLAWHVVLERAPLLPAEFREADFEFYGRMMNGLQAAPERAQSCVEDLALHLPTDLSRAFVSRAFAPELRELADAMFEEIRGVMRDRIESAEWLSASTRAEALQKLEATRLAIGHPERWVDDPLLVMRSDDAYGNAVRAGSAQRRAHFARVGGPADLERWLEPVTWVGGYYHGSKNAIFVTAAMMLLVGDASDTAELYGGLGTLLAHELMHGFDPNGRHYDGSGRLRDWWTEADAAAFAERSQCVADQYSELEYAPGVPIDGSFVVSEQFSELAAWQIAWEAYRRAGHAADRPLRHDLTPEQRFLLTGAQTWCTDATPEAWWVRAGGSSSKAWAAPMVNGTALHLPRFGEAFACRPEQPMMRRAKSRCETW